MTIEQAIDVRSFAISWIEKVVAKRKDYRKRLTDVIDDLIPLNIGKYDAWDILDCEDWDNGDPYGMGDRLRELVEWDEGGFGLSKNAQCDLICAIRIGIDLYIKQSGGVVGYTVGDLRKVFDGNIPEAILNSYENPKTIIKANDDKPIWL